MSRHDYVGVIGPILLALTMGSGALAEPPTLLTDEKRRAIDEAIARARSQQLEAVVESYLERLSGPLAPGEDYRVMVQFRELRLAPEQGVPVYEALLEHPSSVVRQEAAQLLGEYGASARDSVESLLTLAHRRDPDSVVLADVIRAAARVVGPDFGSTFRRESSSQPPRTPSSSAAWALRALPSPTTPEPTPSGTGSAGLGAR